MSLECQSQPAHDEADASQGGNLVEASVSSQCEIVAGARKHGDPQNEKGSALKT